VALDPVHQINVTSVNLLLFFFNFHTSALSLAIAANRLERIHSLAGSEKGRKPMARTGINLACKCQGKIL